MTLCSSFMQKKTKASRLDCPRLRPLYIWITCQWHRPSHASASISSFWSQPKSTHEHSQALLTPSTQWSYSPRQLSGRSGESIRSSASRGQSFVRALNVLLVEAVAVCPFLQPTLLSTLHHSIHCTLSDTHSPLGGIFLAQTSILGMSIGLSKQTCSCQGSSPTQDWSTSVCAYWTHWLTDWQRGMDAWREEDCQEWTWDVWGSAQSGVWTCTSANERAPQK